MNLWSKSWQKYFLCTNHNGKTYNFVFFRPIICLNISFQSSLHLGEMIKLLISHKNSFGNTANIWHLEPTLFICIVSTSSRRDKTWRELEIWFLWICRNGMGAISSRKGKNEHKGTKTGGNKTNHLSTGACTHIKRGHKKIGFKDHQTSMVLD